jgi:hypothetical protein
MKQFGECGLCKNEGELLSWDSNLASRICQYCAPFLDAAEIALLEVKYGHPSDTLVFRNP